MFKTKAVIIDRGPGVSKLAETLGGLGQLRLGIMDDKAAELHPNSKLAVGEVAAVWELGLVPGQPKRSWLGAWVDQNQERMVAEAKAALQEVIKGRMSRKRAFEMLGYKWASEIRSNIAAGGVMPPISQMTAKLKGHSIPLYDSHAVHNAVGYKIFLPRWKNVPGGSAQGAAMALGDTLPGSEITGSPQPPDKPARFGPKKSRWIGMKGDDYVRARKGGPKKQFGPRFDPKKAGKLPKQPKVKLTPAAKLHVKRGPGVPKGTPMRRLSRARARTARGHARHQMKASWAAKWLKKLARKLIKGSHRQKMHR